MKSAAVSCQETLGKLKSLLQKHQSESDLVLWHSNSDQQMINDEFAGLAPILTHTMSVSLNLISTLYLLICKGYFVCPNGAQILREFQQNMGNSVFINN